MKLIHSIITAAVLTLTASNVSAQVVEFVIRPSSLLEQGKALIQQGHGEEAVKYFERALRISNSDLQLAKVHNGLCAAFIIEEEWESALRHCNKAIQLRSNDWRFYNNRGNIYLETGQIDKAIEQYNLGLKLAPQAFTIKRNMELAQNRALAVEEANKKTRPENVNL